MAFKVHRKKEGGGKGHNQGYGNTGDKSAPGFLEKIEVAQPGPEGESENWPQKRRNNHGSDHCGDTIGIHSDCGHDRGQA